MKILIAGSTGLIGSALVPSLKQSGHEVVRLVRSDTCLIERCLQWEPSTGQIDSERLEGFDAVVSLGGVNLAEQRWTKNYKQQIIDSRIKPTQLLAETIAQLKRQPKVWLSASAIGIYGIEPVAPVDESSPPANDFLARLCVDWERACQPALDAGVRIVNMRTGAVLSPKGGALAKMLPLFKIGLGGKLGSGKQIMSWISIDDMVAAITHLLKNDTFDGPVNLVSPSPVTNITFTQLLAKQVRRPALIPVPGFMLKLGLGEMVTYLLLSSADITPQKLLDSGFKFKQPKLALCLAQLIH